MIVHFIELTNRLKTLHSDVIIATWLQQQTITLC